MSQEITDVQMARQPPEGQAIIRLWWAPSKELRRQVGVVKSELATLRKTS
jgi:hypothetical protein